MPSQADLVNRAIQLIGGYNNQLAVTGSYPNFDGTPAGMAAGAIYGSVVATIGRRFGWDFSRNIVALVASGNAPPFPYGQEYIYPAMGLEIRQLQPASLTDPNNPLPVKWVVGNTLVGGNPTKVIWTNLGSAQGVITNQPNENVWDADFTEAVVRMLASGLSMALAGRPDLFREQLAQSDQFQAINTTRDG